MLENLVNSMKGGSMGMAPIIVRKIKFMDHNININLKIILWEYKCFIDLGIKGTNIKIRIEEKRANTPPNLLGIDRKIA